MTNTEPPKRYRGQRGPNKVKKTTMAHITMRVPQEVVDYYGTTIKMREALIRGMESGKQFSRSHCLQHPAQGLIQRACDPLPKWAVGVEPYTPPNTEDPT